MNTSQLNEAQRTLYYIAENMKMDKSISEEGYRHFQMAIKALDNEDVLDKIRAEIEQRKKNSGGEPNRDLAFNVCLQIIDKYRGEVSK